MSLVAHIPPHGRRAAPSNQGLGRVIELTREASFPQALALAEDQPSPIDRARARLYVLHNAGDLSGALGAGMEGLEIIPNDLWLLERVSYISISLRATDLARALVGRLASALAAAKLAESERADWRSLVARYQDQVDALEASSIARSRAAQHAEWTVMCGMSLAIATLALLARPRVRGHGVEANLR
jgi:hypothetical protein